MQCACQKSNSVTTFTLGLAARLAHSDVIMLPRTSLSHLQSYLLPARFILNFYVSCGFWWTCRQSSTSISLGTKRTSGMSVSSGVGLTIFSYNRNAIGLAVAYASVIRTHLSVHSTAHPMSATSVRPRSAADCLNRSAVDISHPRPQENPLASSSAASGPVRSDIINGLGTGAVGRGRNPSLFSSMTTGVVPILLTLLLPLRRRAVVTTCRRKVKHQITVPLRVPWLVVPPLALSLTTRKPMYTRMSPLQTGMPVFVRAL